MVRRRIPKIRFRRLRRKFRLKLRKPRIPRIPFTESLTKLPNLLTYGRILAIPALLWLVHLSSDPARDTRFWALTAACCFVLAAITDFVDGWLARSQNQSTLVGRFLDPVADKLLVMALLVEFAAQGRLPSWLAILLIAREMFINGMRAVAGSEGFEVSVVSLGQWKTGTQFGGLTSLLLYYPDVIPECIIPFPIAFDVIGIYLLYLALFLSLASAVVYVRNFVRAVLRNERAQGVDSG